EHDLAIVGTVAVAGTAAGAGLAAAERHRVVLHQHIGFIDAAIRMRVAMETRRGTPYTRGISIDGLAGERGSTHLSRTAGAQRTEELQLADEVASQLRRSDPGRQRVGGIEVGGPQM